MLSAPRRTAASGRHLLPLHPRNHVQGRGIRNTSGGHTSASCVRNLGVHRQHRSVLRLLCNSGLVPDMPTFPLRIPRAWPHWNTRLAVTGTMFPLLSRTRLGCRQTKQWGGRTGEAPFLY